ncbi:CDC73-domain-containing protein [Rozella allomycis CSF55]|uniref:CDC73-domain-containing protein n=1 Tax=Rozella allomycis (strain CSF55) TaxID=988480 RepID=A0A4P9YPI4_ROZAC|nr:CDC73-domain-containing protein [Rozella allomycis CSF55]
MNDPLTTLKEYLISKQTISLYPNKENFTHIQFGNDLVHRDTLTAFFRQRGKGTAYPIDAIYFAYLHREIRQYGAYLQECKRIGVPNVSLPDRKPLLEYLTESNIDMKKVPHIKFEEVPHFEWVSLENINEPSSKKMKLNENRTDGNTIDADIHDILQYEKPVFTRESLLLSKTDFTPVLSIVKQASRPERKETQMKIDDANASKSPASSVLPIILVPSAVTSLINLHNAKEFLQHESYVQKKSTENRKHSKLIIERNVNGKILKYEITDSVNRFKPSDWDRVVAAFGWKWENPVEIFTHLKGFHLCFDHVRPDPNILKWDVSVLALSENKRHLDATLVFKFWETLDNFMAKRKANLRINN